MEKKIRSMFKLMKEKQFKKIKDGQKLIFQTENFTKQYHSDSTNKVSIF